MATVPLSGTNIRLLSGVPFSNDYKYTRWFDTVTDQTNYFLGKTVVHSMSQANFQRVEGYNFVSVNESIDNLWGTNYLMFQNASYSSKWFYAFVTKLEYKQKNVTWVHFQIDVFHTWKFNMNFKPSYVIREHCKLWNSDGTPVINTIDEGLSYGTEYDTTSVSNYKPNDGWKWLVMLTKTPIHDGGVEKKVAPSVIGTPQPLTVYLSAFKDDDTVPPVVLSDGSGVLLSKPSDIMKGLYTDIDAVNNVVSLYITDYTGIPVTGAASGTLTFPNNGNVVKAVQVSDGAGAFFNCLHVEKVIDFDTITYNNGSKYTGYNTVKESKLLMHPYTQLILDDFKGGRANFKTEYINDPELEIVVKGSLGTSNKTSYGVLNYNFNAGGLKEELSDEYALINNEANDIPIITDLLSAYIQGNRNSLQNQRNTILWNQNMNIAGGFVGGMSSAVTGNIAGAASSMVGMVQGAGNSVLQLQAIQAKQKDIANTPPAIAKMGSNTSYTLGNNYNGVYIIKKQIKTEYIKKLENFFNMYGYKVNEVKLPNFHTRQYWNYVQTAACVITGNFNNEDLNDLKSIFDNGITFWHTDDIGNYSLENGVI
jgi:hypothetical protein